MSRQRWGKQYGMEVRYNIHYFGTGKDSKTKGGAFQIKSFDNEKEAKEFFKIT